ncbi:TraB/GumN family protein [Flavobacterium sp.]|uniref:TraB/GumN family protein n=1 Tax=Flavobacterium sp. TaxID=239 RepID=UPI003D2E040E
MKNYIFFFSLLFISSFAQEKKYQSLLWEVSGNGLEKKSYIYGTMHVSDKVSYHLSDAFYTHLLNADIIANESEPRTWTELFDMFSFYSKYANNNAFYTNFYLTPIEKDELYTLFKSTNYNLIGLLSRTNETNKEYQEDTYLDMFIYRTGRKYNKKTIGLEDVKTSTINIMKAEAEIDNSEVEKNYQTILKILKNKPYNEALVDFYREKDLDMIDSLTVLATPKSYLKALLFDRNIDMVNNMEISMKEGSLFSAIGAAHLPGKKGVIEMLRRRGYKVTPIYDNYTEKGKSLKKKIEDYFIKPEIKLKTTADGMVTFPVFDVVLETGENIESPDLANGGYINLKRTYLNDFLDKKNKPFNPKTLDSLFYENIPGEIISKKTYSEKNYLVYDIKNKTKTGKAQHYRYYITPIEIISIMMGGEGEYVRNFEDEIFSQITLKENTDSWELINPLKGSYQVQIPSYYSFTGNKPDLKGNDDMKIIAFDKKENANYILIEKTLQDNYNLEDSKFELKRIQFEFYNQHNLDSTETHFNNDNFFFTSKSKIGNKEIELKTLMKGNKYYLLGTINASKDNTNKFFNSFAFKPLLNNEEYKTFTDTVAQFQIEIPKKQNEHLDFITDKKNNNSTKKKNHFTSNYKNYEFLSSTGNLIELSYNQYHKYESEISIDSIWANYRKIITRSFSKDNDDVGHLSATEAIENHDLSQSSFASNRWDDIVFRNKRNEPRLTIISENIETDSEKNISTYNALVSKENSKQAIKYKAVFRDGTFYVLKTLVDKNYKNDNTFVEKTFNSFKLLDTIYKNSVFENKLEIFMNDAMSKHDSIRFSALKSIHYLSIKEEDLQKFQYFLSNFKFNNDETEILGDLYEKLGRVKSPRVIPFLESVYKKPNVNTVLQLSVLRALTFQKSKEAYTKILSLLEYDLPISDSSYEIKGIFNYFESDLENSQVLFPDIFQFYSIQEYHNPIIELTNLLINNELVNPKKLKTFKKMLLTNGKLEVKRLNSWKNKQLIKDENTFDDYAPVSDLEGYLNILYSFRNEKTIADLFTKAQRLEIDEIDLAIAKLQLRNDKRVENSLANKILSNPKIKFRGIQMLYHTKQKELINIFGSEDVAKSAITYFESVDPKKDSLSIYTTKKMRFNNTDIKYFFFKKTSIDEDSYNYGKEKITGIAFVTNNDNLITNAFEVLGEESYLEEDKIEAIIKKKIDESLNQNHIRVTHGKLGDGVEYVEEYEEY